ncbi:MAG TPA: hypothetical protein VIQ00_16095 [Chitinophagaceae bacterium]
MPTDPITQEELILNSHLSFRPLLEALKKTIAAGKPGSQKLYGGLIKEFESHAGLMQPISDLSVLDPYTELIEMLLATVFPPTVSETENLYAVTKPFQFQAIYASSLFKHLFIKPGTNQVNVPDEEIGKNLQVQKLQFAYNLILRKYKGIDLPEFNARIHGYLDSKGLTKYHSLKIDARFIDVRKVDESSAIPDIDICCKRNQVMNLKDMQQIIPLENFIFEGLAIVRIEDVTAPQIIAEIKNTLLQTNAFADSSLYSKLEMHIQSLLGLNNLKIGITPFFKINGHYIYSDLHNSNSLLYKQFNSPDEKDDVNDCCFNLFRNNDLPVVFEELNPEKIKNSKQLDLYYQQNVRSLVICPLKIDGELLGILEIVSEKAGTLNSLHVSKIEEAIPLFTVALKRSAENLDNQIDKIIKSRFTAIQPAVEWKFTEAAFNYIVQKHTSEDAKIERIAFDDVYPLFGAVDIRNSSLQRAHSIQLDLIEQLNMVQAIIKKAQDVTSFPLLQEIEFKIKKHISSASDSLLSDEELQIHDFLQHQVTTVFNHLEETVPALKNDLNNYRLALDPQMNMIYLHRKAYDESIASINHHLASFIDKEQVAAQQVYKHYFERYVTDGIEFNIYIGQSLTPRQKFDELYLKNMKMWQLTVLTKSARLTGRLKLDLPVALETTQLILAHSLPISISFRPDERKFDVDGAYNIRYEIIKKRIDKVHIAATNERLTQPGKIAIVYTQPKEAEEYKEFIEFLQSQHLLKPTIEEYDLEELQGVLGLKALRVEVNYENSMHTDKKVELSTTTSQELIGK